MKRVLIYIMLTHLLFACGQDKEQNVDMNGLSPAGQNRSDNQDKPPSISKLRWYPHTWQSSWSNGLIEYLNDTYLLDIELLPEDLRKLNCHGYANATTEEKKHFWLVFMASVSSQESSFNPNTRYFEEPLDEWSQGLFQLSLSDRKPYGGCAALNETNILKPLPNIRCALDIMEIQIKGSKRANRTQGTLFPRRAFYWSVLTRSPAQIKVIEFFKRHLEELPFC
jgi:hypothetical protein